MVKFMRVPISLIGLMIAAPVLAQPATTTSPTTNPPASVMTPSARSDMVDLNSATVVELKALPGVTDSDASKIIQNRPYIDKSQLVSKKVVSEATYDKIKDHIVAKNPKS